MLLQKDNIKSKKRWLTSVFYYFFFLGVSFFILSLDRIFSRLGSNQAIISAHAAMAASLSKLVIAIALPLSVAGKCIVAIKTPSMTAIHTHAAHAHLLIIILIHATMKHAHVKYIQYAGFGKYLGT